MKVNDFIQQYIISNDFRALSPATKRIYGYGFRNISAHLGEMDFSLVKRSDVLNMKEKLSDRPGITNISLRTLSVLFGKAIDHDYASFNHASRVKKMATGHHTAWTVDEVSKMIAHNDRVASVATALAWYTGQREGDVLNMKWGDIGDGYIAVTQQKTGVEMKIKMHSDLTEYLLSVKGDALPADYIVTGEKKISTQSFRNKFKRAQDLIGMDKVFHGIRKGVASNLAENGVSVNGIAALLGHKTLTMAQLYTKDADQTKLTANAVSGLASCLSRQDL